MPYDAKSAKKPELSEDEKQLLLAAIDSKLANAYGGDNDTALSRHRTRLIEAYLGLNTNPAPEGRSQVVDRSVYETISTMLPSLVRIFAGSSEEVCKFVPIGPEDEPGAELTTAYINWLVTQKNPWEQICADWIFDSCQLPNGYAMAYWEDENVSEEETYEGQSDDQLAMLAQDPEIEVLKVDTSVDEQATELAMRGYQQSVQQYQALAAQAQMQMAQQPMQPPAAGQIPQQPPQQPQLPPPPQKPQPVNQHTITVKQKPGYGCPHICVLPPEHCIVDADTPDWTLERCDYFEYRELKTINALRNMGLEVDDDVSDEIEPRDSNEDLARNRFSENQVRQGEESGVMRKVTVRSIWIRCALDDKENAEAKFYYAIIVGRTPLFVEPCTRIPVASMVAQPMPHRHPGMSVSETIIDQQDIKTAVKRGGLDNLYLANNGRHVISDKVNLEDFLDSRPGGVVRMIDGSLPGQGHVFPLTHPFAFNQIVEAMEYFDQERQNRSGVSRYFSGTDAGAINRTASGISQLTNAAAQRVEHIARMMSPAVEYLFSIVHELVLKHANKRAMVQLKGKWTPIDPRAWQTKRDVRISVGVGAGNKDSLLAALNMQFQQQWMVAQSPLGLVQPENLYSTLIEMSKMQGFPNPQKFWTDPQQKPPAPKGPPPEVQVKQLELQHDAQKTQLTTQADAANSERERQLKWAIANLNAETQELVAKLKTQIDAAELALSQQMQVVQQENERLGLRMQMQDQMHQQALSMQPQPISVSTQQTEQQGNAHAEALGHLANMVGALHEAMSKPKTVVRGPDGKIVGVQ